MMGEDLPEIIYQRFCAMMKNEADTVHSPPSQKSLNTTLRLSTWGFLEEVNDKVVKGWEIEAVVLFGPLSGWRQIEDEL